MLTVGSLFAGIGGFDLGLERAGMRCLWQCEIDPYCQRVLAKHWPDVLRVPDVRDVRADTVPAVDVICGGFPCQPVSFAGLGKAQDDERWLWPEFARAIRELRPRYVLVENVPGLLVRGMGDVLGDLAEAGYDCEWACIRASDVGAPHRRDRVWVVAYPAGDGRVERFSDAGGGATRTRSGPELRPGHGRRIVSERGRWRAESGVGVEAHGLSGGLVGPVNAWADGWEDGIPRVAVGVANRVAKLRALGNALVPQIAQWLGERIIAWEAEQGELDAA